MPARVGPFQDLLQCYYGEVGPLHLSNFTDDGNVQALARYKFPHADAQSVEPMGREPFTTSGEMLFYTSLGKNVYPKRYIELRDLIAKRDGQFFISPLHGQIFGYISRFTTTHTAEERNGCKASFTFEEVNTDEEVVPKDLFKDPLTLAEQSAIVADAGLQDLGISLPVGVSSFVVQVDDWSTFINQPRLQTGELTSRLNEFRGNIDRIIGDRSLSATLPGFPSLNKFVPPLADPRNYEVYRALRQLSATIVETAETAQVTSINLIEFRLDFQATAQELALEYYKNVDRAQEILDLNPPRYFFYPKGTLMRISDR